MRFTRLGQFMVGVADNAGLAELYGINKRQVFVTTMLIAGVFVAVGMFLYGMRAQVLPQTSVSLMLFAVAATIIGGIGSIPGAAVAAVILGRRPEREHSGHPFRVAGLSALRLPVPRHRPVSERPAPAAARSRFGTASREIAAEQDTPPAASKA